MKAVTRKRLHRARGQGLTEYIIIVALIAIGAIGVITVFGDNIRKLFGASAAALSGETNVENTGKQASKELQEKTLKSFGKNQ